MDTSVIPLGGKPPDYYDHARADLVDRLPRPLGRVLDVGCGAGAVGAELRRNGAAHLTGIELDPGAAAVAREVFDDVIEGDARAAAERLAVASFDTIVCYDILEHLYDPAAVLRALHTAVAPGGHLHVSVPNARHASLLRDLYIRGTFGYTTWGHRDSTHLRWFTRKDLERLLSECGWAVEDVDTHPFKPYRQVMTFLTGGALRELFAVQWYVLCRG